MNIQMQLSGLIILLLLLYFYKRHDTVGLFSEKMFIKALYVNILCLIFDIVSIILIVNRDRLPVLLVELECKTYLVFLVLTGYMALSYASVDVYRLTKANNYYIKICGVASIVDSIAIYLLPVNIYQEGRVVYTYGPACIATYIGAVSMILLTLFTVVRGGDKMNPRRRKAIKLWMIMWIVAAAIQFVYSQYLLVGFASALGMVILFFELENPEANIDRKTGVFNARAFSEYIKQCFNQGKDSCGIFLALGDNHMYETSMYDRMDDLVFEISRFLRVLPNAKIFKTDVREFAILFSDKDDMEKACEMIDNRFKTTWLDSDGSEDAVVLNPYVIIVSSITLVKSEEELINLLKYFRAHIMNNPEGHTMFVDESTVEAKRVREEMIDTINGALADDRVEVFYQPIYSTAKKRFTSAEALVRIRRDDGSLIPPGMFIPVAEETGLIAKLGERVFEKTCQFITENKLANYGVEYIEVNLSVVQCENKSLARTYIDIMDRHNIPPSFINLEITETASIAMRKILLDNMKVLIDYGVRFSLDDFGNGESNLNYIVDMPVEIVKFDKDMTQAYFKNEKAKHVLRAATDMIHGLKLKVVAEGVETKQQLDTLEGLGIDYIQGYYFSKPVEAGQYLKFLRQNNIMTYKDNMRNERIYSANGR
jgi:EAL domain-containing protein (putative c-di-GMP-specific phosphodiesterase class I)/GGDEF domain-containing protein